MNKKRFWLITFVIALCASLVAAFGCADDGGNSQPAKDKESVTITNKLDLTDVWHVDDADRQLVLELTDGLKSITPAVSSDNPDSVTVVDGNKIHAVAAGNATVTVSVTKGDKTYSDSFDITVKNKLQFAVTNKEALETTWSKYDEPERIIQVNINNIDEYSADDVVVTSSKPEIIKAEGRKLTALKGGDGVEITVSLGGITHKITMSVRVNPMLTLSSEREAVYYVGAQYDLPTVTKAVDSYDADKTAAVSVTPSQGLTVEGGKLSAERHGKYTVKYSFLDEVTNQEIEEVVPFEIVNEIFAGSEMGIGTGAHAGTGSGTPLADAGIKIALEGNDTDGYKEVVTSSQTAVMFAKLKGGEASEYYYAEAAYEVPQNDGNVLIGMGHMFHTASTTYRQHAFVSLVDCNNHDLRSGAMQFNYQSNIYIGKATTDNPLPYTYKVMISKHLDELESGKYIKYAVARDGDYFYLFINDQYVSCYTHETFRKRATVPAIIGEQFGKTVNGQTKIRDINYLWESASVKAKLNSLLGENREKMIVPYSGAEAGSGKTYEKSFEGNKFTTDISDASGERGLGFDYSTPANFNDSVVSPYIWFDKNFTFQWEYKHTDPDVAFKSSSNTYRNMLEIRDWKYHNEQVQFGAIYRRNDVLRNEFYMNAMGYSNNNGYKTYGEPMNGEGKGFDDSLGARFTVTRIVKADHAEITMTATSLADGKTYTRIVQIGGLDEATAVSTKADYKTMHTFWNQPVILLWHNTCKGEYSNIKWSVLPDENASTDSYSGTDKFEITPSAEYTVPADTLTLTRLTEDITVGEEPDTTTETVNLNEWSFTVEDGALFDIVADFGEGAAAGKYDITLCAKGDKGLGDNAAKDIALSEMFTVTVELEAGQRYVKLNTKSLGMNTGIPVGAGRYVIKVSAHAEEAVASDGALNVAGVYVSKSGELFADVAKATA